MRYKIPFRYIGSKSYIAPWIIEHFPSHHCYVEVFGGSGAVLFRKNLSPYEVYNDLYSEVYIFFKELRDSTTQLVDFLRYTPPSRQLVEEYGEIDPTELSTIERAARFFLLSTLTYSGIGKFAPKSGYATFPIRSGYRRDQDYRNIGAGQRYKSKVDHLFVFAERLRNVIIENLDFQALISKYDYEDCLFYVDPPYMGRDLYSVTFTEDDHYALSELLHTIEGKVIISYYPSDELSGLYSPSKWTYDSKEVERQVAKGTNSPRKAVELLIMNYDPRKDKWRGRGQTAIDQFW